MSNDWIVAIAGYLSVPLVALATKRHWPNELKFVIAAGVAAGAAAVGLLIDGSLTRAAFVAGFTTCFAAQQATWALRIPGAGSPAVNEPLVDLGSGGDADEPDEHPDEPVGDEV